VPKAADRWLEAGALCAILGLAAYLRLANLPDNPGWFTDEGTHLNIAQHLAQGEVRYFALNQSTLLAAGLLRLGGEPMMTLRAVEVWPLVFQSGEIRVYRNPFPEASRTERARRGLG
jgi:hypothetical protein